VSSVVSVVGLVKEYDGAAVVDGVSLDIRPGEVFALLGPNGAGKSTTIEILEGHRRRTAGDVSVLGMDPERGGRELRDRIGIVLQETGIDKELTPREVIVAYSGGYRRRRGADELLELVGLGEKADARVGTLSGGQQRRLDLALGLSGTPELLFLDEPTTGFDPSARRGAWELIGRMRSGGTTVLLTTHYMDEAQHLADRVAVITRGRIVAAGTPDSLGRRGDGRVIVRFERPEAVPLPDPPATGERWQVEGRHVRVESSEPTRLLHELTGWAIERGVELAGLTVERPSLEDVYLELTGGD
jgi:ABC-2 type transport system ATP-binding protein